MTERKYNGALTPRAKALRRELTAEERKLWYEFLRNYPVHCYKQRIIGSYIADFYCAAAKLVIELDGSQHYEDEGVKRDQERTAYLREQGLEVVRIPNNEIHRNFEGVCAYLDRLIQERTSPALCATSPNRGG